MPDRPEIERLLRQAGLSHRQARKLLSVGWRGVVGEQQAEHDELKQKLAELEARMREGSTTEV
jgi:hypothetical protein